MNTKPKLTLTLTNVGPGATLSAELKGDFGGPEAQSLKDVELEIIGDQVWDVDRQKLLEEDKLIVVELEGGEIDRSADLTSRVNRLISLVVGTGVWSSTPTT